MHFGHKLITFAVGLAIAVGAQALPQVKILATGGTIAGTASSSTQMTGYKAGNLGVQVLINAVPQIKQYAEVSGEQVSNIGSQNMTDKIWLKLAKRCNELLADPNVSGIVITHGTDTLEETAYLLDLVHNSEKPVCLTGAMRSAAEISPDGPANLLCAVRTAASPEARGKGVLVVMNEEIHAAREVVKSHSANTETFVSPFWGPLGYVDPDRVVFRRNTLGRQSIRPPELVEDVHLIKLASGSDSLLIDFLVERNVRGIVLEGFGRGNVPPAVLPGIRRAVERGIPVVITTRTIAGRVLDVYGYEGG
ncbi:MAG: asparaginase, partial [Sutterella sp.]|nr:asparaginase [Sutterella sp.]